MKVIRNSNERLMTGCFIFAVIGLLFLCIVLFRYRRQLGDYVTVEAKVEGVQTDYGQATETLLNRYYRVVYSYTYDEREYISSRPALLKAGHAKGEKKTIRINPDNPEQLEDTLKQKALFLGILIFGLFTVLEFRNAVHNIPMLIREFTGR